MKSFFFFFTFYFSEEVFGQSHSKVGSSHEDGDGADDVEDTEPHQAQAVNDGRSELPLLRHTQLAVLLADALHQELHLHQESLQLAVHCYRPDQPALGMQGC